MRNLDNLSYTDLSTIVKTCKDQIWMIEDQILQLEMKKLLFKKNQQIAEEEMEYRNGR